MEVQEVVVVGTSQVVVEARGWAEDVTSGNERARRWGGPTVFRVELAS